MLVAHYFYTTILFNRNVSPPATNQILLNLWNGRPIFFSDSFNSIYNDNNLLQNLLDRHCAALLWPQFISLIIGCMLKSWFVTVVKLDQLKISRATKEAREHFLRSDRNKKSATLSWIQPNELLPKAKIAAAVLQFLEVTRKLLAHKNSVISKSLFY